MDQQIKIFFPVLESVVVVVAEAFVLELGLMSKGERRGGLLSLRVALELSLITHFYGSLAHAMYLFIYPLRAFYKLFESLCDGTNCGWSWCRSER